MNHMFETYGSFVARRPLIPLMIGILLLGGLSVGLIRRQDETELEKLWVEHNSRVVEESHFFNNRFGGVPRKEGILIYSKSKEPLDLKHAMDALKSAITPLYDDSFNMSMQVGQDMLHFNQHDFCERPIVITSLQSGSDPWQANNWVAWGYRKLVSYIAADNIFPVKELPENWGIDELPCFKVSPMDCFKEGGDFDYPEPLRQIDQPIGPGFTLPQALFELFLESKMDKLEKELVNEFNNHPQETNAEKRIEEILSNVRSFAKIAAAWGYSWRKSYKEMKTSKEIIDYINGAITTAKNASTNPLDAAAVHCIRDQVSCCLSWFGVHIPIEAALGNVVHDNKGNISQVGAIRWAANHFHQNHPLWIDYIQEKANTGYTESQRKDLIIKWEDHLVKTLIPLRQNMPNTTFGPDEKNSDLQVQFSMWKSTEDVIKDANHTPQWELILSIALVSTYAVIAFINVRDPVHSHTMLVLAGMAVVSFAILAGFGLTAAVGIKFTPLAGSVVPFLTLGLGIDDIFVLTTILRSYLKDPKLEILNSAVPSIPENEMRLTVALAGPSLVLTTFSILASFFISSLNPMPIVQWFCWQMGITASIHTVGMLFIFVPLMSIDARRVKAGVVDPCLWLFCGLHIKKDVKFERQARISLLSKFVAKYYAPLLHNNIFKSGVVIIFVGLLGSMIYLGTKVEHGLKISEVTVKGSYQHDYAVITENGFPVYDIWIVTKSLDYPNSQPQLLDIYETMQGLQHWAPPQPKVLEASWLGNLYLFINKSHIPPKNFYTTMQDWSQSAFGPLSMQDLSCHDSSRNKPVSCMAKGNISNYRIAATKSMLFANNLGAETRPNLDMIKQTRKALDNANEKYFNGTKQAYAYGYPYLFFEQYLHSTADLLIVVGFALVGVFTAVLLFQCSFTIAFMIAIVLLMVDVEVFGFLYVIGAKLNSLSLVNLGIVIGMASEFTYLARCFLAVDGTRNERVGKALELTFEPLLHGLGTQIAATFPLIFLKYHAFRLYYFAMFTIMGVLGFLNGFVLLPVLLSVFGPPPLPHVRMDRTANDVINENTTTGDINSTAALVVPAQDLHAHSGSSPSPHGDLHRPPSPPRSSV